MAVVVFLPLASATIVYLLLLLGWLTVVVICFNQGIWLNAALPIAASVPPVVALAVLREGFEWFRVRRLVAAREALSRFQAPDLARRIADDPGFLLVPLPPPCIARRTRPAAVARTGLASADGCTRRAMPLIGEAPADEGADPGRAAIAPPARVDVRATPPVAVLGRGGAPRLSTSPSATYAAMVFLGDRFIIATSGCANPRRRRARGCGGPSRAHPRG